MTCLLTIKLCNIKLKFDTPSTLNRWKDCNSISIAMFTFSSRNVTERRGIQLILKIHWVKWKIIKSWNESFKCIGVEGRENGQNIA